MFYNIKVDELGKITIPSKIRKELHIKTGEILSIETAEEIILVTKEKKFCVFCGRETDLIDFRYKHICLKCVNRIKSTLDIEF